MDFVESVGIAVPGTVNQTTIIKAVNLGIENYEITPIIEKETGTKVKLKNDGKCAGLAEQKYGELQGYDNSVFLCIGTGVGSAVIFNGKLLEPKGVPGFEFSHTIIQKNETFSKYYILEDFLLFKIKSIKTTNKIIIFKIY